jgi:hypothetical protein
MLLIYALPANAQEQDRTLQETLQMLSEDAAIKYINPVSSAFGANLNGGWFHRAPQAKKFSFNLEFGVVAMGSFFPDAAKSFDTRGSFRFRRSEAEKLTENIALPTNTKEALISEIVSKDFSVGIKGATVIGDSSNHIKIYFPGQDITFTDPNTHQQTTQNVGSKTIELPFGGFGNLANVKALPLGAPQLTLGTIYGTQATLRFLPKIKINDDLGDFSYFGYGLQHNPQVWLPVELPVDLAAGFYMQTLKIGDLFKTKTTSFGLNASKQFGWRMLNFTPYTGFMYENAKMNVKYDFLVDNPDGTQSNIPINFELEAENKMRLTLGFNIRLGIFNLNADYNFGKYKSVTAGLMIAI